MPYVECPTKLAQRKLTVTLFPQQAATLRALQEGLEHEQALTAQGNPVMSNLDTLRWILDKLGE